MAEEFKKYGWRIRNHNWNYGGEKWRLSRSKIDLFMECPRCFYLDNKLGASRPKGPSFTLNVAVDALLKKEFDTHRLAKTPHPYMSHYKVDAVPFQHEKMNTWRENFEGVDFFHKETGLTISGAIDDIWINKDDELIIVDYKATSKDGAMDKLSDTKWENQYKRQMEIYQWLFRQNGFKVSNTGYFVYVNGRKDKEAFDGKLEFDVSLISYEGNADWVEGILPKIKKCLDDPRIPPQGESCDFCSYVKGVKILEVERYRANNPSSSSSVLRESESITVPKKIIRRKASGGTKKKIPPAHKMPTLF